MASRRSPTRDRAKDETDKSNGSAGGNPTLKTGADEAAAHPIGASAVKRGINPNGAKPAADPHGWMRAFKKVHPVLFLPASPLRSWIGRLLQIEEDAWTKICRAHGVKGYDVDAVYAALSRLNLKRHAKQRAHLLSDLGTVLNARTGIAALTAVFEVAYRPLRVRAQIGAALEASGRKLKSGDHITERRRRDGEIRDEAAQLNSNLSQRAIAAHLSKTSKFRNVPEDTIRRILRKKVDQQSFS